MASVYMSPADYLAFYEWAKGFTKMGTGPDQYA